MEAVFVFNADGSLVLATHPVIASEFHALESSSWLFIGFGLAGSATQTMVGVATILGLGRMSLTTCSSASYPTSMAASL